VKTVANKYQSQLAHQAANEWDLERDVPWQAIDSQKPLIPLDSLFSKIPGITPEERVALSQLLGLMTVKAIGEHEHVLSAIREHCERHVNPNVPNVEDLKLLMNQFFSEEAKHSAAFARYVSTFAQDAGISLSDLNQILPTFSARSWFTKIILWNGRLGGNAAWHLMQLTEHESVDLFRYLKTIDNTIDPLYYNLHRLHYEEELRHISFPPIIIRQGNFRKSTQQLNSRFARGVHAFWMLVQFMRLSHIHRLRNRHPFFAALQSAKQKIGWRRYLTFLFHAGNVVLKGQRFSTRIQP
jgi:hypothetical protein